MSYLQDFRTRDDLISRYGNNALLLYALQLRFDIADIISVASEALTDSSDDKKCDLIYVDRDMGVAVVAQGYMRQNPKPGDGAPGNKASDLNTAAAWIFSMRPEDVPDKIRDQVQDLQSAIRNDEISTVYFWYVHNLNESTNPQVHQELIAMQANTRVTVFGNFPDSNVEVFALEVGNETIEKWYNTSEKQITILDEIPVDTKHIGFEIQGAEWKAYVTAVKASWLKTQYIAHTDELFSGNPRTYLGSGKKKNKINLGIIETIQAEPDNFWAYNNGVTALVNDYKIDVDGQTQDESLTITGITIINGAQTTGAISAVDDLQDAWVPIRFIVCKNPNIINDIINNNNKQNEILPSDLRSNDKCQNRLREEFQQYPQLYYSGGRRGDVRPSRSKEVLDPYVVAQAILAFHGDCVTAYNSRTDLWHSDKLYSTIFPDQLTAEHIIFVYSLSRAVDIYKLGLQNKKDSRTDSEEAQHKFMSKRGAKMLLLYTIAKCMESVVGHKIHDSWSFAFADNNNFENLVQLWNRLITIFMPLAPQLEPALADGLKSKESADQVANTVVGLFTAIRGTVNGIVSPFVEQLANNK